MYCIYCILLYYIYQYKFADVITTSMPNKHSFIFNLEPFGLKNTNTIFQSIEEPSGLIESVVRRNNAKL